MLPRMNRSPEYESFLQGKSVVANPVGFNPQPIKSPLFPFQADILRWAIKRGRAALIEDCGLGKGPQQIEWGYQVAAHTGKPVIGFAPLTVSQQFVGEGEKFGISVNRCESAADVRPGVNITNYERLHHFTDPTMFGGMFLDESSCLKGFDGKFRAKITEFGRQIPYRVCATATIAPNDFMEIGTHAEFLDIMSLPEMLATFFTHDGGDTSKWRLKGHGAAKFWEWLASWAVCIRRPSDLGYEDGAFILPELQMHQHTVECAAPDGYLFPIESDTLTERHEARRDSISERVAKCAALVNNSDEQWTVWCNLNAESDALHYAIRDAVQVVGADSPAFKEKTALDFKEGRIRVLVSKPSIFGFGQNMQNCHNTAFVGLSDSFEQFYQAIRRHWRFGQTKVVNCHVICAETEGAVVRNIRRKESQANQMFDSMVAHMREISAREIHGAYHQRDAYDAMSPMIIPEWIRSEAA